MLAHDELPVILRGPDAEVSGPRGVCDDNTPQADSRTRLNEALGEANW